MKLTSCLKEYVAVAAPSALPLLLTVVLLTAVLLPAIASAQAQPPPPPGVVEPPPPPPPQTGIDTPPPAPTSPNQPPAIEEPPPPPGPGVTAPDPTAPDPTAPDPTAPAHPSAPSSPPADCIIAHAATPAQLCPIAGGLQYYFIGADGSTRTGPYIYPFSELATLHTSFATLYDGINSFTGKAVYIQYLPTEHKIRVITFYPDTEYDTNKPYNFTVDEDHTVNHEAW